MTTMIEKSLKKVNIQSEKVFLEQIHDHDGNFECIVHNQMNNATYPTHAFISKKYIFEMNEKYFYPIFAAIGAPGDTDGRIYVTFDLLMIKKVNKIDFARIMSICEFRDEYFQYLCGWEKNNVEAMMSVKKKFLKVYRENEIQHKV